MKSSRGQRPLLGALLVIPIKHQFLGVQAAIRLSPRRHTPPKSTISCGDLQANGQVFGHLLRPASRRPVLFSFRAMWDGRKESGVVPPTKTPQTNSAADQPPNPCPNPQSFSQAFLGVQSKSMTPHPLHTPTARFPRVSRGRRKRRGAASAEACGARTGWKWWTPLDSDSSKNWTTCLGKK